MFRFPMASTSSFEFLGCTVCCCCTGWSEVDCPEADGAEFAGCCVVCGLLGSCGQLAGFGGVCCCDGWPCVFCGGCAQGFCGCSRTGAGFAGLLSDCARAKEGQAANAPSSKKP